MDLEKSCVELHLFEPGALLGRHLYCYSRWNFSKGSNRQHKKLQSIGSAAAGVPMLSDYIKMELIQFFPIFSHFEVKKKKSQMTVIDL